MDTLQIQLFGNLKISIILVAANLLHLLQIRKNDQIKYRILHPHAPLPLHHVTLHAPMLQCIMRFTPCLVHHAPFCHALCPMAFQQCNWDIAPTLFAFRMVNGVIVHKLWCMDMDTWCMEYGHGKWGMVYLIMVHTAHEHYVPSPVHGVWWIGAQCTECDTQGLGLWNQQHSFSSILTPKSETTSLLITTSDIRDTLPIHFTASEIRGIRCLCFQRHVSDFIDASLILETSKFSNFRKLLITLATQEIWNLFFSNYCYTHIAWIFDALTIPKI